MAKSDVAIAPLEISPVDNQTQEFAPPSEAAVPSNSEEEVEKEVKETQDKEEVEVESEEAAAGEEVGEANQDLKRKLEVQEETERQLEGAGNGEDVNEGEEEREGSEAKRQKTETEEALKSGEALEEQPRGIENLEHNINNNLEQIAEEDVQKDDFTPDKTETGDGSSDTCRKIEFPNHRVGVLIGKAGDTMRNMQKLSGARLQIAPDAITHAVEIFGSIESIDKAEQLVRDVRAEADAGRPPPLYGRGFNTSQSSTSEVEIQVSNDEQMSSEDETSSEDEMDEIINNVLNVVINTNNWFLNAMQMCLADWKEVRNERPMTGREWVTNILEGHHQRCHSCFHMNAEFFLVLCDEVKQKGIITEIDVTIEEQVGMFLQIVAHSDSMRKVGEDFQHSTETVWRCFNKVLRSILRMRPDYMKLPSSDGPIHPKVSEGTLHAPFKDALGAIDGTHIPAFVDLDAEDNEVFRNRKQVYSQNVMAIVDFDGNFLAAVAGWEGSAHDNLILHRALEDGLVVPPNRYYLVDGGYANTRQFLGPYRGRPYHLAAFENQSLTSNQYECPEDLFNHRHAQLRNIVEKTFGILKNRFKICQRMHKYKYKIQTRIVIACCIIHNFINYRNRLQQVSDEEEFDRVVQNDISVGDDSILEDVGAKDSEEGDELRGAIKNILWGTKCDKICSGIQKDCNV